MIKIFTRDCGEKWASYNFKLKEFFCKCGKCRDQKIDLDLITLLQDIRDAYCGPIKINSGFRCEEHNKKIGGSPKSQHLLGKAADLKGDFEKLANLFKAGGVGTYNTFTHIDVREDWARWNKRSKK